MRLLKTCIFTVIFALFFNTGKVQADHFLGGEITWKCLGSGQYKFQIIYYRDCGGQTAPNSLMLYSSVIGLPTLNLYAYSQVDVSPDGFQANGTTACLICPAATPTSFAFASLIEKITFESIPVTLPGVPPPGGWVFWYEDCCRNPVTNNVNFAGQAAYLRLEARMFATGNQTAGICDDSSPFFVETPSFMSCLGIDKELQHLAIDPDDDFLIYEFAPSLSDSGLVLPMMPGYTFSQPLPGFTQNPNNFVTNINMFNGEVLLNSHTNGRFVLNVKVTAYRGSTKVSEIRRSYDLIITANCPPIIGNAPNLPPLWDAPFLDSTAAYTLYEDTVFAGDVVNFSKSLLEYDFFENGSYQQGIFSVAGSQFGENFNSDSTGCLTPPCATIDLAIPDTFLLATTFVFNWQTAAAHLNTVGWNPAKTYYFLFRASDNYCPVNGSKVRIVSITVVDSTVGLPVSTSAQLFHVFPTASLDGFYQIFNPGNSNLAWTVVVTDVAGKIVWENLSSRKKLDNLHIIDLSNQSRGMYFVNVNGTVKRILKL